MSCLRKSLDEDFDRQRQTLLAAFNEELTRALKSNPILTERRQSSSSSSEQEKLDLKSELDRHRRQLDEELRRNLSESVVDLKNELTVTLKEQEKEILKLMVKSRTGNDPPSK